jgi:hypothetical protein
MTIDTDITEMFFKMTAPAVTFWPNMVEAKGAKLHGGKTGKLGFGATFVFAKNHPDFKTLVERAKYLCKKFQPNWTDKEIKEVISKAFVPGEKWVADERKKGNTYEKMYAVVPGSYMLKTFSEFQPALAAIINGKAMDLKDEAIKVHKNVFYNGVEALAQFKLQPMETPQGKFLVKYLQTFVSLNKGDKMGEERSAASMFSSYVGKETKDDPTKGLEDAF